MTDLRLPQIDDRVYDELVADAIARISIHNPEWTNHNEADPGITIIQLFSFMTETLLYRSKLIPERNRLAFLRMLGVDVKGATAAKGAVSFSNARGAIAASIIDDGTLLYAGSVPFRTTTGLAVLPVEVRPYTKSATALPTDEESELRAEYSAYYASFLAGTSSELTFYETSEVVWPRTPSETFSLANTIDGSLWLAVMARPGDDVEVVRAALDAQVLSLAFVPAVDERSKTIPAGSAVAAAASQIEVHIPDTSTPLSNDPATRVATYAPVDHVASGDLLRESGVMQIQLPSAEQLRTWALEPTEAGVGTFPPALDGADAERLVTWLRLRPEADADDTIGGQREMRLTWLGANAAFVEQLSHTGNERVGTGSGEPDQEFTLANTPVIVDSLEVTVDGQRWERVDDLMTAGPEVPSAAASGTASALDVAPTKVFTVDRSTGLVRFGTGIHGTRPRAGDQILATYDFGGGTAGMVAPGAITKGPTLPPGIAVTNPVSTWGGVEAESMAAAERTVAGFIRTRAQLVSSDDFAAASWNAPGIDLGRVDVLPLFHPNLGAVRVPGVVTLVVVPAADPAQPDAPQPDRLFLDTLCEHLSPQRLITTELYLTGPEYVPIWVSVGFDPEQGRDLAPVIDAIKQRLRDVLSPLPSGSERGWRLGRSVDRLELFTEVARVDGVSRVVDVELADSFGTLQESIPMSGIELPRIVGLSVRQGAPGPAVPHSETSSPDLVPVPYVPEVC